VTLQPESTEYARRLGLFDGVMMTVGGIIGAGIFLNPAIVAQRVGTASLTLAAWVIGGLIALAGAFCFAELGGRMPRAGGGYVYLRDAFGRLPAFLYGWTLLLVINSGALAAVAMIAASYTATLLPALAPHALPLAIAYLWLFTLVNILGIVPGALAQNLFTLLKLAALCLLIAVGMVAPPPPAGAVSALATAPVGWAATLAALGAALIPVMFATGGWQNSNFIGAEIRNPQRNLPRAIVIGVVIVVAVYVLANLAYLRALGVGGLAAADAPAARVLETVLGRVGATLISGGIVASTLGILNLFILAAPRVYQAMADDGLFFRRASRLHPRFSTPVGALVFQAAWTSVLALSGTYGQLLDYVVFGDWIFFGLVAATLFVYRRRDRPTGSTDGFRAPALPIVGGAFVAAAAVIVVSSVVSNPGNAALGAVLIASGIPVYLFWQNRARSGPNSGKTASAK
jgi:APA family basic amino acid/polyamine antiporter